MAGVIFCDIFYVSEKVSRINCEFPSNVVKISILFSVNIAVDIEKIENSESRSFDGSRGTPMVNMWFQTKSAFARRRKLIIESDFVDEIVYGISELIFVVFAFVPLR